MAAQHYEDFGLNWDGVKKPKLFKENEMLLQRGAKFEVKNVKYNGKWHIELELKGFDVQEYEIYVKEYIDKKIKKEGFYCVYQQ